MSKERTIGDYMKVPVTDDYDAVIVFSPYDAHLSTRSFTKAEKIVDSFSVAFSTKHPIRKVGYMHDWLEAWKVGVIEALAESFHPEEMMLFFVYKP